MAVTSREVRGATSKRPLSTLPGGSVSMIAYAVTAILALLAVYALLSTVIGWGQTRIDDVRYLQTRTFHLSGYVGHEGSTGAPTRFIAANLDRQIVILELPGGDANAVRSLPAPYLFGAGEDRTPVTLRLEDVNNDELPDLLARIKDEEMIYINRDGQFTLLTAEERQQIMSTRE